MKKFITIMLISIGVYHSQAQQLSVPLTIQEHDQWCWSGCSTCILNYYNFPVSQCQVAEYARTASTVINFGAVNCCVDASQGCNLPNYDWGFPGSIVDILDHFGNINCGTFNMPLALTSIQSNVANNHLMVFHWSWLPLGSGGHFVVGTGVNGTNVFYMNPWPGEGYQMDSYTALMNDGAHVYDGTVTILAPTKVNAIAAPVDGESIYPNPSTGAVYVRNATTVQVYNALGQQVYQQAIASSDIGTYVDLSGLSKGIYFVQLNSGNDGNFSKLVLH